MDIFILLGDPDSLEGHVSFGLEKNVTYISVYI
jgi:hypothetical protein